MKSKIRFYMTAWSLAGLSALNGCSDDVGMDQGIDAITSWDSDSADTVDSDSFFHAEPESYNFDMSEDECDAAEGCRPMFAQPYDSEGKCFSLVDAYICCVCGDGGSCLLSLHVSDDPETGNCYLFGDSCIPPQWKVDDPTKDPDGNCDEVVGDIYCEK